jgi:hypothetical protein
MINKAHAIISLVPNAEVAVREGVVEWINPSVAPVTESEINAEIARLQAEYEAKEYQRARAVAYPTIQEQLDLLYWDKVNGTNNWEAAIEAVKTEYPKP